MDGESIIGLVAVVGLIFIPSLAIAVRLSLKPMVEAIVRLHEGLSRTGTGTELSGETAGIRAQLNRLEETVQKLSESDAFDRELRASRREILAPAEAIGREGVPQQRLRPERGAAEDI